MGLYSISLLSTVACFRLLGRMFSNVEETAALGPLGYEITTSYISSPDQLSEKFPRAWPPAALAPAF